MTQRQLAERLHVTQQTVSWMEKQGFVNIVQAWAVAKTMGDQYQGETKMYWCTHCHTAFISAHEANWCPHCGWEDSLN